MRKIAFLMVLGLLLALTACKPGKTALPDLVLQAITPTSGDAAGGVAVTLSGAGFFEVLSGSGYRGSLRVTVCGAPLTDVRVVGEVRTVVLPPAGAISIRIGDTITGTTAPAVGTSSDVTVVRPDGEQATLAGAFSCQLAPVAEPQQVTTPEDTPLAITLQASGVDPASATFAVSTPPANGSLSGTAPDLTYTPNADVNGSDSFAFTVSAGGQTSAPATVEITITPVNDAPSFTILGDQTIPAGTTAPQSVPGFVTGVVFGPADESTQAVAEYLVSVTDDPAGIFTAAPQIAVDGTLSYTPNGAAGSATVEAVLRDDGGTADGGIDTSAPVTFTITVTPPTPPTANADGVYTVSVSDTLTLDAAAGLLANDDLGVPAATLTSFGGSSLGGAVTDNAAGSSVALAGGSLTVNADGSMTFAAPTTVGTYSFEYRLENSAGSSDALVTFSVVVGPVAQDDAFTTTTGATLAGDLFVDNGAGADDRGTPPGTITGFGGGSLGGSVTDNAAGASVALAGGTLTVNADGTFSLANPTSGGTFTFDYRLENSVGSSDATVTITVQQPPTAVDDANPGGVYTVTIGGTLTIPDGPNDLLANDDLGVPAATLTSFGGGDVGGTVTDNAAGASAALAGGSLTVNADGAFTLAGPTTGGTFTFDYRLANLVGSSDATVTVVVQAAPLAVDDTVAAGSSPGDPLHAFLDTPLVVPDGAGDLLANDGLGVPAATLTSFGGGDLGGTVTDNAAGATATFGSGLLMVNADGSFTFTPATGFTGLFTFDYRITNPVGSDDATVTLAVGVRPAAAADAFSSLGNVGLNAAAGVLFADNGSGVDLGDAVSVTAVQGSSANVGAAVATGAGGSVTIAADGSFSYDPPVGYEGLDTFTYAAGNGFGSGAAATVSITVSNVIWFLDNSDTGANVGTLADPFQSAAAFNAAAAVQAGDDIYLAETGNSYGGLVLQNNQQLVGEGASGGSLAALLGLVTPAHSRALPATGGLRPVIATGGTPGITLATGNTVRGLDVGATGAGPALTDGGATVGTLTVRDVAVSGSGALLDLTTGGTLDAVFDSLASTSSTTAVMLDGLGGSLTVNGATNVSGATTGIDLRNALGGATFDFGATTISSTGTGVNLTSNAGSSATFDSLSVTTAAGTGLLANNGGTLNIGGTGNTVTAVGGAGVSLTNTTIGVGGITFASLSASNTVDGIVLDTAGSAGFTVNGGSLQNLSARGIEVRTTNNVTFAGMTLTSAGTTDGGGAGVCDDTTVSGCNAAVYLDTVTNATLSNLTINGTIEEVGIVGSNVSGFTLANSVVGGAGAPCGNAITEGCLKLFGLTGTSAISNSTLAFAADRVAQIHNSSGSLTLSVTNSTFSDTQSSGLGADGLEIRLTGSAQATIDVTGSSFLRNRTNGLQLLAENNANVSVDVTTSTFDAQTGPGIGLDLVAANSATLDFNVINNPTIHGNGGSAVNVAGFDSAAIQGRVNSNPAISVGGPSTSGFGINLTMNDASTGVFEVDNNTVSNIGFDAGIRAMARSGTGRLDVVMTNNTVTVDTLSLYDFWVQAGSGGTDTNTTCALLSGNTASGNGLAALRVRESGSGTVLLQGFSVDAATTWSNRNSGSPVSESPVGAASGGTCTTVSHPLP